MGEHFWAVIIYSFYIFEENYIDLSSTIQEYISTTEENTFGGEGLIQLHLDGGRELSRMLHNYVAAWYSMKEHAMRIKKKLKSSEREEVRAFLHEYQNKIDEALGGRFENIFISEMRRYSQHKLVPIPTLVP